MNVARLPVQIALSTLLLSVVATVPPAQATDFSSWQVGGFVFVAPKYEGSKDYRVLGFPYVAPAGFDEGGVVTVRGADDVRLRLLNYNGFELGAVGGWRFGRDEDDGRLLWGLGDIDGGLALGAFAAYRFGLMKASVAYSHQVSGDDGGGLLRFGLEAEERVRPHVRLSGGVGLTWADDDYMQTYFGVTPLQSLGSVAGLPTFDADAGIKDVHLWGAVDYALDARWNLKLVGQYSRLVGDAADSPVIETENQFYAGVGLSYRFGEPANGMSYGYEADRAFRR